MYLVIKGWGEWCRSVWLCDLSCERRSKKLAMSPSGCRARRHVNSMVLLARRSVVDHMRGIAQRISDSRITISSRFDTTKGGGGGGASIGREVSGRRLVK